jgi:hypothetical protein
MNGIVINSIVFVMVGMVCETASDEEGIVAGFLGCCSLVNKSRSAGMERSTE